jgi:hypothetical protein
MVAAQKATDLRALRLNRTLLWLPIEAMPERNAENVTALRGLPADKLKSYRIVSSRATTPTCWWSWKTAWPRHRSGSMASAWCGSAARP